MPCTAVSRFNDSDYPNFKTGAQGGWSYMIAKISPNVPADFKSYIKELKSGYNYGIDGAFFISPSYGFGVKYSGFSTKNEMSDIYSLDTATKKVRTGVMKDNISIQFIGPTFNTRAISPSGNFHFNCYASIGYLGYKNDGVLIDDYTLNSSTVGTALGLGFDVAVLPSMFVGIDISGIFGTLRSMEYNDAALAKKSNFRKTNMKEYPG